VRRIGPTALGLLLLARAAAGADGAELQLRPFAGAAFLGSTTFVDLEKAAGKAHIISGADVVWIGNVFGVEADVSWARAFFHSGDQHLVLHSGVSTVTGSVVVAMPRRLTEYTLRPYVVAGAGLMHVGIDDYFGVLSLHETLAAYDLGGGVVGFLTNRVGLAWDVRRFGTLKGSPPATGLVFGDAGRLSFWRASMALVLRY